MTRFTLSKFIVKKISKKVLKFGLCFTIGIILLVSGQQDYANAKFPTTNPYPTPVVIPVQPIKPVSQPVTKYGHFPYREAPAKSLVGVGNGQRLHQEGAAAMKMMVQAAKKQGVYLFPLSGFRSVAVQSELFEAQIQRRGSVKAAARISAPPGYSEHHTGYAMDFGDRDRSDTDLEETFARTPAFKWLEQNAAQYGFELSFTPGNSQGVIYEPWHWRYTGSQRAQQVFALAKQNSQNSPIS